MSISSNSPSEPSSRRPSPNWCSKLESSGRQSVLGQAVKTQSGVLSTSVAVSRKGVATMWLRGFRSGCGLAYGMRPACPERDRHRATNPMPLPSGHRRKPSHLDVVYIHPALVVPHVYRSDVTLPHILGHDACEIDGKPGLRTGRAVLHSGLVPVVAPAVSCKRDEQLCMGSVWALHPHHRPYRDHRRLGWQGRQLDRVVHAAAARMTAVRAS